MKSETSKRFALGATTPAQRLNETQDDLTETGERLNGIAKVICGDCLSPECAGCL